MQSYCTRTLRKIAADFELFKILRPYYKQQNQFIDKRFDF